MQKHKEPKERNIGHKEGHGKNKDNDSLNKPIIIIGSILLLIVIITLFQTNAVKNSFESKIAAAKEEARPANIELKIIKNPNCNDCFNIDEVVDSIKKKNVKIVTSAELSAQNAQEIIQAYNIKRLPALIVLGETEKARLRDFEKRGDALVYTKVTPPYTDALSGEIKGRVSATLINPENCSSCSELRTVIDGFKSAGITMSSVTELNFGEEKARELVSSLSINKLPALILSDDIFDYGEEYASSIRQVGTEKGDKIIIEALVPPFINVSTGETEGLISVVYLTDKSCPECYDAQGFHKRIIQSLSTNPNQETTIDISSEEGAALLEKYSIKKVPTILISGDVTMYPSLVNAWQQVGTQEPDGTFVFRNIDLIGQVYKDIESGKVVKPKAAQR